jgi:hypothetical protein
MVSVVKVVYQDGKYICKVDKIQDAVKPTYEAIYPDYLFMAFVEGDVPEMEAIGTVLMSKKVQIVKEEKNANLEPMQTPKETIVEKAKPKKAKE